MTATKKEREGTCNDRGNGVKCCVVGLVSTITRATLTEPIIEGKHTHTSTAAHRLTLVHARLGQLLLQHPVQQARKVAVQALVARNELVREGEAVHEPALLQPKNGAEGARKENALHGRERDEALRKRGVGLVGPPQRPVRLLHHGGDRVYRVEQLLLLCCVLDVRVNKQRVHFAVDVLDGDLRRRAAAKWGEMQLSVVSVEGRLAHTHTHGDALTWNP